MKIARLLSAEDEERERDPAFGMIGITAGQTARLNVANPATGGPVTRELMFLDGAGAVVVTAASLPVRKTVLLPPGQADHLDLNGDEVVTAAASRLQIRALDPWCGAQCADGRRERIIQSLELIDNASGKTTLVMIPLGPPQMPVGPPVIPAMFGMMGLTAGQTARLNVVNAIPVGPPAIPVGPPLIPQGPRTRLELMFVDSNGNQLVDAAGVPVKTEVTLDPGKSAFLDLNADAMPVGPPSFAGRVGLRALVRALPNGPPGDDATGSANKEH